MSVLFQALNRAAQEYGQQQQSAVVPLLSSEGREVFSDSNIFATVSGIILALLLIIGIYYVSAQWSVDRAISLGQEQNEQVAQDTSDKSAPADVGQGIILSEESLAATVPEKDTIAVMEKIQEMPLTPEVNVKRARIVVHGSADENHARSADIAYEMQKSGKSSDAIEIWHQILLGNPNDDVARNNLVSALADMATPAAMLELRQITDLRPEFAPAHASLAKLLATNGDTSEAARHLQKALEIEPKNNIYRLSLAILFDRMEQGEKALALYNKALESRATDANTSLPLTWEAVEQRVKYLASR